MIVVMSSGASASQLEQVKEKLTEWGFGIHFSQGVERTILGVIGEKRPGIMETIEAMG